MHLKRGGLTEVPLAVVTTNCEKSAEPIVVKKFSVMEMERRGEQSISLKYVSYFAEMSKHLPITNRVKGGQIKRDGKERTHGHK